jgi:hypothetical protein
VEVLLAHGANIEAEDDVRLHGVLLESLQGTLLVRL